MNTTARPPCDNRKAAEFADAVRTGFVMDVRALVEALPSALEKLSGA